MRDTQRKAADRKAVIAKHGLKTWIMPGRRETNKKREASRKACRGKQEA